MQRSYFPNPIRPGDKIRLGGHLPPDGGARISKLDDPNAIKHHIAVTKMRRPLSPTLAKLAEQEVNETPDRIQQDIIILRVWIRQQPHLRARTDVDFLIAFLRRCRYSLEETKRRIDRYFTHYNLFPEIMNNRCVTQRLLDINRMG